MVVLFCFKQKTAYEMRISDWSSDVCSSDLKDRRFRRPRWFYYLRKRRFLKRKLLFVKKKKRNRLKKKVVRKITRVVAWLRFRKSQLLRQQLRLRKTKLLVFCQHQQQQSVKAVRVNLRGLLKNFKLIDWSCNQKKNIRRQRLDRKRVV